MLWTRLIPFLLAASVIKTAVVGPPDVAQFSNVLERTKVGTQRGELRSYAQMLESDAIVGQSLSRQKIVASVGGNEPTRPLSVMMMGVRESLIMWAMRSGG